MQNEITPFERWMRNKVKKRKDAEDQLILDQMLSDLKKSHENQKQQQIEGLTKELKKAKG